MPIYAAVLLAPSVALPQRAGDADPSIAQTAPARQRATGAQPIHADPLWGGPAAGSPAARTGRGEPPGPPPSLAQGAAASVREAATGGRAEGLRAVVRLRVGGRLVCTGTLVAREGRVPAVLTAAHCLYTLDAEGRLLARRATLDAEGVATLEVSTALVSHAFATCAAQQETYRECVARRAADVALIPVSPEAPRGITPWTVCSRPPPRREVTVFGFGLDRARLPRVLLLGAFTVRGALASPGARRAVGLGGVRVDFGDSGGPVISAQDDARLDARVPCVRFISTAAQRGDLYDPTSSEVSALLQPVWGTNLTALFTARPRAGAGADPP